MWMPLVFSREMCSRAVIVVGVPERTDCFLFVTTCRQARLTEERTQAFRSRRGNFPALCLSCAQSHRGGAGDESRSPHTETNKKITTRSEQRRGRGKVCRERVQRRSPTCTSSADGLSLKQEKGVPTDCSTVQLTVFV